MTDSKRRFTARQLKVALQIAQVAGFEADKVDSKCHDFKLASAHGPQSEESARRVAELKAGLGVALDAYAVDVRALPGCIRITWDSRAISAVVAANQD